MPVPVWDCSDMSLLDEPLDTVLSDDIWKKFDLDDPLDVSYMSGGTSGVQHTAVSGPMHGGAMSEKTMTTMTMMIGGAGATNSYDESITSHSATEFYDKLSCSAALSREIRHHDCMWAGLCISKEHNRTSPAKMDGLVHSKKIPAGRSLLISSRSCNVTNQQIQPQQSLHHHQQQQHQQMQSQSIYQQQRARKDDLESDGDSARPETPQSSAESESESDEEEEEDEEAEDDEEEEEEKDEEGIAEKNASSRVKSRRRLIGNNQHRIKQEVDDLPLIFKHDQISINEKLSECMSDEMTNVKAAPVSEVTGQFVRRFQHQQQQHQLTKTRVKVEDDFDYYEQINGRLKPDEEHNNNNNNYYNDKYSSINNNNHSHHNHHYQNTRQQYNNGTPNGDRTIVKTEPDNWHTLNDHCYHQPSSKKLEHLGVQTPSDSEEEIDVVTFEKPCRPAALPTYPSIADQQLFQHTVNSALKEKPVTAPRPRGRPPLNGTPRKRSSAQNEEKPAKRPRHKTYQRRSKVTKNGPPTPAPSPVKNAVGISSSPGSISSPTSTMSMGSGGQQSNAGTSRSNSSDDEPDTEKRSLHNNMERQRRIELRNAFEELRVLVPEVEAKEKAPKVAILRQAAVYCDMLTENGQIMVSRVAEMKRRQERLRSRLSQLRRSLAMTR